ncbi:hypothetical protein WJX73_003356 [Symbiochloris irregularis]|uniref:Secreted protein n=1 Tax=Symbiochloris irregularis TaxID=706552 RepID=A0AAW1NTJ3_9CHLO
MAVRLWRGRLRCTYLLLLGGRSIGREHLLLPPRPFQGWCMRVEAAATGGLGSGAQETRLHNSLTSSVRT